MEKKELLLTKLKEYCSTDFYPMHMPGHKRNGNYSLLKNFPNPFSIDITEIDGFDNLHHPEYLLKTSMEWAANIYHADQTYYLVNGSSGGILSAIGSVTKKNGTILVGRNCHKSVYHGIILKSLNVRFVYPQIIEKMGIQGGIPVKGVEDALMDDSDIQAVLIVSPTYDGIVSDIAAIAEVVHAHGIPLIVDEAHGAHFSFGGTDFPKSAIDCGADIVIQSLHKTLPSLTQTAIMHVKKGLIDLEKLEQYLQIYQTSSPSYVFMASIESCIYEMEQHGYRYLHELKCEIDKMNIRLGNLNALRILKKEIKGKGVFDLDPAKIVISCRDCLYAADSHPMDGGQLAEILRNRYHIEMEMSSVDYVTAIVSCFDSEEGMKRLCEALLEIDKDLIRFEDDTVQNDMTRWRQPEICMNMAEATEMKQERIFLQESEGRISAEFIYLYPPGIPIVAPGELVTKEIVERVLDYKKKGFSVQGMGDKRAEYIRVIDEE